MRGYDVAGVGGGGILAIGIAYVKVAPFFRRSRHTHTHTQIFFSASIIEKQHLTTVHLTTSAAAA